jgi:glycerophosphoryl diester phosphodiesterase
VEVKVHGCLWSGVYAENSLAAVEECYHAGVARAEIDLSMLQEADFLVIHDLLLDEATTGRGPVAQITRHAAQGLRLRGHDGLMTAERPALFSEVAALIREQRYPTRLELDLKDVRPLPWPRVEELARLVEPVKDRVVLNSIADWNLRRLLHVDPTLPVGFDPMAYLDWVPAGAEADGEGLPRGAYGYMDEHWLARERTTSVRDYLWDRLGGILRLTPGVHEVHVRLATFERMLDDGVEDAAALFQQQGLKLDVWTLDAGTPHWQQRLGRALAAGGDVVTSNTAPALAAAGRAGPEQ